MAAANQTTQLHTIKNAKGEVVAIVRANSQTEAQYIAGVPLSSKETTVTSVAHDTVIVHEKG